MASRCGVRCATPDPHRAPRFPQGRAPGEDWWAVFFSDSQQPPILLIRVFGRELLTPGNRSAVSSRQQKSGIRV